MRNSFFLLSSSLLFLACTTQKQTQIHQEQIQQKTEAIIPAIKQLRNEFHQIPEIAKNEVLTKQKVKDYLKEIGLEILPDSYGHAVIGVLKGKSPGPSIAWRSDMDALNLHDPGHHKTKTAGNNIQHACGHDVHMAIALGIAKALKEQEKYLKGTIYFIFQPEEETFQGAQGILASDSWKKLNIEAIYGLHVTALPVGQIAVKENEIFAYQQRIRLQFNQLLSTEQLTSLQSAISQHIYRNQKGSRPEDISKIIDPKLGILNPNSGFADFLFTSNFSSGSRNNQSRLDFDYYETDKNKVKPVLEQIKQVVKDQGLANQLIAYNILQSNPTIQNNPVLTTDAFRKIPTLKPLYGQVPYFNDDFAFFQQSIPGVYFLLGGSNFEKGIIAMNHSLDFQVDEDCMKVAIQTFVPFLLKNGVQERK